jgi:hypothetical protein
MTMPAIPGELDPKFEMLTEAVLFLIRHIPVPNLADAFLADLHRAAAGDPAKLRIVEDWSYQLRERDELIPENDA